MSHNLTQIQKSTCETTLSLPQINKEKLAIHDRLKTIIRTISGHFNIEVKSEFTELEKMEMVVNGINPETNWSMQTIHDPETNKIIKRLVNIPNEILESTENVAKGKAAHEAGHVAITRYGEFIPEKVRNEVGFSAIMAALEERATDQTIRKRLAGAGLWINEARQDSAKEVELIYQNKQIPKIFQLASLIVYAPHFMEVPSGICNEVVELYADIKTMVEVTENTIPDETANEKEIRDKSISRYKQAYLNIWPKVKKLVDQDIQELSRQEQDKQENAGNQQKNSDEPATAEEQKSSEEKEEKTDSSDDTDANQEKKESDKENDKDENKSNASSDENEQTAEQQDENNDAGTDQNEDTQSDDGNNSSAEKDNNKLLKEKVIEYLRQVEEEIVKEYSGKFNEDNERLDDDDIDAYHDKSEEISKKESIDKRQEKIQKELAEIEQRLKSLNEKNRNLYDAVYEQIRVHERKLYQELEEIFSPNLKPLTKLKSSGSRINLPAVFRWEASRKAGAKAVDSKIFEVVHIPEKKDYAISLLVDTSGSMDGQKIDEAFKAVVLISEVLNRLGIQFEVAGFSDYYISHNKKFHEKLNNQTRNNLSMLYNANGNTNTHEALAFAYNNLIQQSAKEKFIIAITDGLPDDSSATHEIISWINSQTDQKIIGLGLGQDTDMVQDFFPASIPNINAEDLPNVLSRLLKEVITNPNKFN